MPLIRNGHIVRDDWTAIADEDAVPESGDVIVSLERFRAQRHALKQRDGRAGISLDNVTDPDDIGDLLSEIDLVALNFPAFTDGRAYSQARQLRSQLGYKGELRATGVVLADQAAFLKRVGFDSFEVDEGLSIEVWNRAVKSMSVAYQRGYDGLQTTRQN